MRELSMLENEIKILNNQLKQANKASTKDSGLHLQRVNGSALKCSLTDGHTECHPEGCKKCEHYR